MRLLLVEDDENKTVQISGFIKSACARVTLDTARSLQSGLRALRKERPDVVLLDMTLPNYDTGPDEHGGHMHPFGGREFLNQMDRFDLDIPVIVITQFETFGKGAQATDLGSLNAQLRKEHPSRYKGAVYYHAAIHGWKEDLLDLLGSLGVPRNERRRAERQ